jgi:S1-C subfamily serine protease
MIGANQLKTKTGVYVFEILPDGNFYNTQLRLGDIIVEFEGKPVGTVDSLISISMKTWLEKKFHWVF